MSKIDVQLTSIYNALQVNGVSKNDVTTSSIGVYPRYNYTSTGSVIIGYTVYVYLSITIRGIDTNPNKIGTIIDAIASTGVSSIYGITYDTTNPYAGKAQARKNAWNDAVSKAKQYAALSSRKLGKVLVIDETNLYYYPIYYGNQAPGLMENDSMQGLRSTSLGVAAATPQIPTGWVLATVSNVITW